MTDTENILQVLPALQLLLVAIWGACLGSLINVVVWRLPRMLTQPEAGFNLFLPASHCPQCKTPLGWRDNIPLLGWLRLAGRCRHCQVAISHRYPLTELAFMLTALLLAWWFPSPGLLLAALLFSGILLALALIDSDCQLLPDALTLPLLWAGLLFHLWQPGGVVTLEAAVIGAATGYLSLWTLYWLFYFMTRREALGYGDFKLLAALGAWLGWRSLPLLLLLAALTAIVVILLTRGWRRRALTDPVPFGPWLALAGWILFLVQHSAHPPQALLAMLT